MSSIRGPYVAGIAGVGSDLKFQSNFVGRSLPSSSRPVQAPLGHEQEQIYDVVLIGRTLESLFVLERLPPAVERVLVIDDGGGNTANGEAEQRGGDGERWGGTSRLGGPSSWQSSLGCEAAASYASSSTSLSSLALVSAALPCFESILSSSSGQLMRLPHTIHPGSKPLALKYFAEKKNRLAELVTVGVEEGSTGGVQNAARAPAGTSVTLPTALLFADFCASLIEGLKSHAYDVRVVQGSVAGVEEQRGEDGGDDGGYVAVEVLGSSIRDGVVGDMESLPDGGRSIARHRYRARTVVVSSSSLGYGVAPVIPSWWQAYLQERLTHETDERIPLSTPSPKKAACLASGVHVVVVGGGMTAATRALEILESSSDALVTLITRRALLKQAFDVDQGWWGTKYMNSFEALTSSSKRLEACRVARPRGSLRGDVYEKLMDSAAWGERLRVFQGVDVQTCDRIEEIDERGQFAAKLLLRLVRHPDLSKADAAEVVAAIHRTSDGCPDTEEDIVCDAVEIACGSAFDVATHPVLGLMVGRGNVEVLGGYPVVQSDCRLSQGSRIFVAGRGAMIAVGPCGGNMVGMRTSAERICGAVAGIIAGDRSVPSGVDGAEGECFGDEGGKKESDGRAFDPVKRVTTWTCVDGVVLDDGEDKDGTSLDFPLESSNALSLLPKTASTKAKNPLDPTALPCRKMQHLESYAFSDDGFRLSIITSFPEPISRDRVRIRVTRSSLEVWFIGSDTAYHVHVARLYGNVLPERTALIVKEDKRRVTIRLYKEKDVEWKFLKG
jgi:hypothetical protein